MHSCQVFFLTKDHANYWAALASLGRITTLSYTIKARMVTAPIPVMTYQIWFG